MNQDSRLFTPRGGTRSCWDITCLTAFHKHRDAYSEVTATASTGLRIECALSISSTQVTIVHPHCNSHDMKYRRSLLLTIAVSLGACQSLSSQTTGSFDPLELQTSFGRAKDLELVTKVSEIPPDGQQKLASLAAPGGTGSPLGALADIGMDWSSSDVRLPGLPSGQHLFSAVSDQLVAIVFVTGGTDVQYNLILARRNAEDFCWFRIPLLHPSNLRLSVLQELVRPDRDQTTSRTPECQVMHSGGRR